MSCLVHNNTRIRLASWTAFPLCPYQDSNLRTSTSTWHVVLRRVSSFTCRLRIVRASETEEGFLTTSKPIKSVLFSHPTNVSYSLAFLGVGLITDKRIQTSVIYITVCPLLTSLTVGQPWLFQPYTSFLLQPQENLFRNFPRTLWAVYPLFGHFVSSSLIYKLYFKKANIFQKFLIFDKLYIF